MNFWKRAFYLLDKSAKECKRLALVSTLLSFILGIAEYLLMMVILYSVFSALQTGKMDNLLITAIFCSVGAVVYLILCYFKNVYSDLNWFRINVFGERRAVKQLHQMNSLNPIREQSEETLLNTIRQGSSGLSIFLSSTSRISSAMAVLILLIGYSVNRSLSILVILTIILVLTFAGLVLSWRILFLLEPLRQKSLVICEKSAGLAASGIVLRCFGKEAVKQEIRQFQADREQLWATTWRQERKLSLTRSLQDSLLLMLKGSLPRCFYSDYTNNRLSYDEMSTAINSFEQVRQVISRQVYPYQQAVRAKTALVHLERWYQYSCDDQRQHCDCIEVRSLFLEINGKTILRDINFTLKKGEHVALIGANGSGKSTLLRCLMGFLEPQKGQLLYQNQELEGLSYEQRRGFFTWIPNQAMLFSTTVERNIQMNQDEDESVDLTALIQSIGLNKEKTDFVSRFSDGEQQRVNILRALAHQSDWLVADEPTARLQQSLSYNAIKQILDSNESCLIVTHQLEQLKLFDRVLVMESGKLIYDGPACEYCSENN